MDLFHRYLFRMDSSVGRENFPAGKKIVPAGSVHDVT